jgi:hypothetical protein
MEPTYSVRISIPVSLKERKEEFELDTVLKAIIFNLRQSKVLKLEFNSNDLITFYFVDKLSHYGLSMDEQDLFEKNFKALRSQRVAFAGKNQAWHSRGQVNQSEMQITENVPHE